MFNLAKLESDPSLTTERRYLFWNCKMTNNAAIRDISKTIFKNRPGVQGIVFSPSVLSITGCLVSNGAGFTDFISHSCPWYGYLQCNGTGEVEIPIGEVGMRV